MHLSDYIAAERGRGAALAEELKVPPESVSQWKSGIRPVPLERCAAIERATDGHVTRRDLRPLDWWLHWPELITDEFPVPTAKRQARKAAAA